MQERAETEGLNYEEIQALAADLMSKEPAATIKRVVVEETKGTGELWIGAGPFTCGHDFPGLGLCLFTPGSYVRVAVSQRRTLCPRGGLLPTIPQAGPTSGTRLRRKLCGSGQLRKRQQPEESTWYRDIGWQEGLLCKAYAGPCALAGRSRSILSPDSIILLF